MAAEITVPQAIASATIVIATFTVYFLKKGDNLNDQYASKVDDLQSEAWSETSSKLADFFDTVEETMDGSDVDLPGDMTRSDEVDFIITQHLSRDELEPVEDNLAEVDRYKNLLKTARSGFRSAGKRFGVGCLANIAIVILYIWSPSESDPWFILLVAVSVAAFATGIDTLHDAMTAQDKLDDQWDELYFE